MRKNILSLIFLAVIGAASVVPFCAGCSLTQSNRLEQVRVQYPLVRGGLSLGAAFLPPEQAAQLLRLLEEVQGVLDAGAGQADIVSLHALGHRAVDLAVDAGKLEPEQGMAAKALLDLLVRELSRAAESRPASQPAGR